MAMELSEADTKVAIEIQNSLTETRKKLYGLNATYKSQQTSKRKNELTIQELKELPNGTNTYKSVGRM